MQDAVAAGQGTREIGGSLGTRETGDYIAASRAKDTAMTTYRRRLTGSQR